MERRLQFEVLAEVESGGPVLNLDLVPDPSATVEVFAEGLLPWCEMAHLQLDYPEVYADPDALARWARAAASRSRSADQCLGIAKRIIERERDRLESGSRSLLEQVQADVGAPSFEPTDVEAFLTTWTSLLWSHLRSMIYVRHDKGAHPRMPDTSWKPPPETMRVPSVVSLAESVVEAAVVYEPDNTAVERLVGTLTGELALAASCVYLGHDHPRLQRRLYGLFADGLSRREKPSTTRLQRTRIFLSWRRVLVAAEHGHIDLRCTGQYEPGTPIYMRARRVQQAIAALSRDAFVSCPELARVPSPASVDWEVRRATAQLLYTMEQLLDDDDAFGGLFTKLLDDYCSRPDLFNDHEPSAGQEEL